MKIHFQKKNFFSYVELHFFYHAKNLQKKSTLKSLKNHELVSHVVDSKTVYCICSKHVRLDREYDTDLQLRHANNNKCKKTSEGK